MPFYVRYAHMESIGVQIGVQIQPLWLPKTGLYRINIKESVYFYSDQGEAYEEA